MINRIHSIFHRPESGWDPVSAAHANEYAELQWRTFDPSLVDKLEEKLGGLSGKRVLDLGGGPGHFSVAFARRGSDVTWHDISWRYREFAMRKAAAAKVRLTYSVGYLEEASRFPENSFDLVFCRLAWAYCMNDRRFARLVYSLVKPGMLGYVDCNTLALDEALSARHRVSYLINAWLGWKIGHPYPPHGRIEALLLKHPMDSVALDYSTGVNDRILFRKSP